MIGQEIGNYKVVSRIGAGGMGEVFEATHQQLGRRAAIKRLHPQNSNDPESLQRFFNEARAVNIVQHPSLVNIFEFGRLEDGAAYIIMEYLEGETLRSRCRKSGGRLDTSCLPIIRQVASALAATHQKGIVHRDLKPDNVMLVPDPEVPGGERAKILDFGIAKLASTVPGKPGEAGAADSGGSAGSVKTRTGAMLGTPTYMAPEQCRGVGPIDDRVDVYSLGVMIYELMAGDPPFVSDGFGELVAMHMFEPAPPLGKKVPKVNPELAGLVGRMLAKKAPERPSMAEVVRVLERIIAQSPGAKHPSLVGGVDPVPESLREGKGGAAVGAELTGQPYPSTLGRSAGQRVGLGEGTGTRRSAVLAGAAGLLVVAAGVGIWFRPRPTPALPPAPIVQVTPTPALPAPPVPSVETPVGRGAAPAAPGMNPGAPSPGANPSVPSPGVAPSAPAPGAPAAIPGDAGDAGRRQIEQLVRTGKQKQRAGDLSGAQVAFARAIKLERKNPAPYYLLLAQAQAAGKQYADALDTVNKLLSVEPGSQSGQLLKREISGMLAESRRR